MDLTWSSGAIILVLPVNREDLLSRSSRKLTGYISTLFLLLITAVYTGVYQDNLHSSKDANNDDCYMAGFDESGL